MIPNGNGDEEKVSNEDDEFKKMGSKINEIDMMKERFAKLLLGEDMSGSGKGVCIALAISNAITNLCATIFGQLWRLEPISEEKKSMRKREMEWLVCVSDHIVEFIPSWQNFPDGSKLEVMTCRPRSDIFINLAALRQLDNMLLDIVDSFTNTEFWYVDQGIVALEADGSSSFRQTLQRQEEKWWLPVPRVPAGGLVSMTIAGLNGVMGTAYYYGPCGKHDIEKEAEKLEPCAYAAQHWRAPVSKRCCTVMEKKVKNPACLCAVLFSQTAYNAGVRPEIAVTIPKRCNIVDRPVGYKCRAYTLL